MATKILLVDLDKDYIRRTENSSEFRLNHDLFQEAVTNLKQDIKYWAASSGINMDLETVNETEVEHVQQGTLTKTHTRVYAKLDNEDDLAWVNLSIGIIKPASKLAHGELRGWQFDWGTK